MAASRSRRFFYLSRFAKNDQKCLNKFFLSFSVQIMITLLPSYDYSTSTIFMIVSPFGASLLKTRF